MISGINAFNPGFLANINNIENQLAEDNNEISSGIRVNEPSDDPGAIASILDTQNQIDQATQVQQNLSPAKTTAQTADSALQNASNLLDQLTSIASEGSSSTTSPTSESALALQVQSIEQELASIANTSMNGQYIFGGSDTAIAPYTFNLLDPNGVALQSQFSISGNLDSSGTAPPALTVPIVDSLGHTQNLTVTFAQSASNTWNYQISIPAADLSLAQITSSTSNGSASITLGSTTGISVGQSVSGTGIPSSTTVQSISGNTITLSNNATASGTVSLSFTPPPSGPQIISSGTLTFNADGTLSSGTASPVIVGLGNLADGADNMTLNWNLFGSGENGLITQTAQPSGVTVQVPTSANTALLHDASGNSITSGMTASQIFDSQNGAGSGVFAQVYALWQALQSGNQSVIQNAAIGLKSAVTQISEADTTYGDIEDWINQANQSASQELTNLQANLSTLRDADIPTVATQLTTDETALDAAMSAHATLSNKTLFDYLG